MMKHPVLKEVQKQNLETVGSPMVEPFAKNYQLEHLKTSIGLPSSIENWDTSGRNWLKK